MKNLRLAASILLLGGLALILLFRVSITPPTQSQPVAVSGFGAGSASAAPSSSAVLPRPLTRDSAESRPQNAGSLASRAGEFVVDSKIPTNLSQEAVLQNIRRAVREYGEMFNGNPIGNNPEITAALSGKNPKHVDFLKGQPGVGLSPDGEMIDSWGTPYFFHQVSGTVMEVRSAGPDKIMWTSDDLVIE
jgi:hypothetical protein